MNLTVEDICVKGKKVLVRCDFNVPLNDKLEITDDNRIVGALPTIQYLIENGAKVILCSHMGKPKGEPKPELSLAPVAKSLSEKLGKEVVFAADDNVVGENAKQAVANMKDGDVVLLENTRYRAEETKNVDTFSAELASLADVFVNDAFGTAHRAHCSNVGVTKYLDTAVAGYLIEKEIKFLGNAVNSPVRPLVAILGGSKVSSKISVIENLLKKVDKLIIGGGMAYTFFAAQGKTTGTSLLEPDYIDYAKKMLEQAGDKILLPIDTVVAKEFSNDAESKVVEGDIPEGWMGLDIGPKTIELYKTALDGAKTVVWNGPMGVFEMPNFAKGTNAIALKLAELDATTVIGGGDSVAAVNQAGLGSRMSHISTGGGASLEYLEGKELPGIACLNTKKKVIAGNWKMNKTPSEAAALIKELAPKVADAKDTVIVCPTAVCLSAAVEAAKGTNIKVGAQNVYFENSGAYTGEISADMLLDLGIEYVIIGHSERRQYFAETDETVNKKVLKAFEKGLTPIICVGESLEQREYGITNDLVRLQTKIALSGLTEEQVSKTIIAYEPIWAIGTGKTATTEQAEEVCKAIRECVAEVYGNKAARKIAIQYGGSVNAGNAAELFAENDIDGGLVGGASLKAPDFATIVNWK